MYVRPDSDGNWWERRAKNESDGSANKNTLKRKRVVAFGENEQDDVPASQTHTAEGPAIKLLALDTGFMRDAQTESRDIRPHVSLLEEMVGIFGCDKAGYATSKENKTVSYTHLTLPTNREV